MSSSIACIDYRNNKVLIAKRANKGDMANRWEFPGGKLEKDDDFISAIKREMKEEFNVSVEVGNHITHGEFIHAQKKCTLDAFFVHLEHDGITKPYQISEEHTEYKWCELEKVPSLNFVDSDLSIYPEIVKAVKNELY